MISIGVEDFPLLDFNVPRETLEALREFHSIVLKWNKIVHLVSNNESKNLWRRHFADCYQLGELIKEGESKILVDFGSGSGFPGIILGIMGNYKEIHLIESNKKKSIFLEEASRLCKNKIFIHPDRIEDLPNLHADIITARALTNLDRYIALSRLHSNESSKLFSFKGMKFDEELYVAKKNWNFEYNKFPSKVLNDSFIIEIKNIKAKLNN